MGFMVHQEACLISFSYSKELLYFYLYSLVVLSWGVTLASWGHVDMSGHIFGCPDSQRCYLPYLVGGDKLILLSPPPHAGQPHNRKWSQCQLCNHWKLLRSKNNCWAASSLWLLARGDQPVGSMAESNPGLSSCSENSNFADSAWCFWTVGCLEAPDLGGEHCGDQKSRALSWRPGGVLA